MQKNNIKNIHLFTVNNKLNRNIFDCESIYNIRHIDDNIYKYYHTKINDGDSDNHIFLFNSSYMNSEIIDFTKSASKNHKIIIFIDNDDYSMITDSNIEYIINNSSSIESGPNVYKLPDNIVNKSLYQKILTPKNKKNVLVYFSYNDDQKNIEKLKDYIYPKSKLPIKIFDNNKIKHPQNMGYTSEQTKQRLLLESRYYIHDSSNYYLEESTLSGCINLNLETIKNLEEDMVGEKYKASTNTKASYYVDFIRKIIDEKQ